MRILVTGANGQLGRELRDCLARMETEIGPLPEAYRGAEVDHAGRAELDIADPASVSAWFGGHGPYDLVVNCASATNVDRCETDRETALLVNGTAVGHVAAAAEAQGAALVHVSTDYVFSGTKGAPYVESDEPDPVSFYGRSKLVGERNALGLCSRAFVVRTSWLYGRHGRNFVNTMLALGASQARVSVVDDQFGNPTNANDLVFELLAIALTDEYGIYHCSGNGTCSCVRVRPVDHGRRPTGLHGGPLHHGGVERPAPPGPPPARLVAGQQAPRGHRRRPHAAVARSHRLVPGPANRTRVRRPHRRTATVRDMAPPGFPRMLYL